LSLIFILQYFIYLKLSFSFFLFILFSGVYCILIWFIKNWPLDYFFLLSFHRLQVLNIRSSLELIKPFLFFSFCYVYIYYILVFFLSFVVLTMPKDQTKWEGEAWLPWEESDWCACIVLFFCLCCFKSVFYLKKF
jgi:hypothetical protein